MTRGDNAQRAVDLFHRLRTDMRLDASTAWKAIARMLLTCEVWGDGGWRAFHGVVVHRERNDLKLTPGGKPSAALRHAQRLSIYLAGELGCEPSAICAEVGLYFRDPMIRTLQPNNLLGHAFRSLVTECLKTWGSPAIRYEEEVDPRDLYPGARFETRSKNPRVDIVAFKGREVAALISCRWRYRHDRVDVPDEAMAYMPSARRENRSTRFYGVVGEFAPVRLAKMLKFADPDANPVINAIVHFNPALVREGIGANGSIASLKSLHWLVEQTHRW